MSSNFIQVASVLVALAIGLAIGGGFWWRSLRADTDPAAVSTATGAARQRSARMPTMLVVAAAGLLVAVVVLYFVGADAVGRSDASRQSVRSQNPAVGALAASLGVDLGASAATTPPANTQGGDLDVMTARLARRLREKTPEDHESWALLARSYVELGRDDEAVAAYERTGPLLKRDAAVAAELAAARARLAGAGNRTTTSSESSAAGAVLIAGNIDAEPGVRARIPSSGHVFVIARGSGQPGAPIAARKLPLTHLPMKFTLSDADAMLPGQKLSSLQSVDLLVRISATGDATARDGDLESVPMAVKVGAVDVTVKLAKAKG